jgi:hypothetical protein
LRIRGLVADAVLDALSVDDRVGRWETWLWKRPTRTLLAIDATDRVAGFVTFTVDTGEIATGLVEMRLVAATAGSNLPLN